MTTRLVVSDLVKKPRQTFAVYRNLVAVFSNTEYAEAANSFIKNLTLVKLSLFKSHGYHCRFARHTPQESLHAV